MTRYACRAIIYMALTSSSTGKKRTVNDKTPSFEVRQAYSIRLMVLRELVIRKRCQVKRDRQQKRHPKVPFLFAKVMLRNCDAYLQCKRCYLSLRCFCRQPYCVDNRRTGWCVGSDCESHRL